VIPPEKWAVIAVRLGYDRGVGQTGLSTTRLDASAGALWYAEAVCGADDMEALERRCLATMTRLVPAPMFGFYELDPHTGNPLRVAGRNVSDAFLAKFERGGRDSDALLGSVLDTGEAAYSLDLFSIEEWVESEVFQGYKRLHDIRQVIVAPITSPRGLIGTMHFASDSGERAYGPDDVMLAATLGRITGMAIERLRARERLAIERDQALAALELTQAAVVLSDPSALEPQLNARARSLLAEVEDGERALYRILARPEVAGGFSRQIEVALRGGGRAVLRGSSSSVGDPTGSMVTVLELRDSDRELAATPLSVLTPREREVARAVVEGHSDREIGERLFLSHHTVRQHVKQIFRKLEVDSRVALTRLLLDA
jgi:DNA-binding NarL/FixJ family response regulator